MTNITSEFDIGQEVYLKTDRDQQKRMIVGILIRPRGLQYEMACGSSCSWHYDFEISIEKDVVMATTNE